MTPDCVNHPTHYNSHPSGVEAIDACEGLSFNIGNALKYVLRAPHSGKGYTDFRKAVWYVQREITRRLQAKKDPLAIDAPFSKLREIVCGETDEDLREVLSLLWAAAAPSYELDTDSLDRLSKKLVSVLESKRWG